MFASSFAVDETYELDDVFDRASGRVYATGIQALVRLLLAQRRADLKAGLNTAGFVSGYRGSPVAGLDRVLEQQRDRLQHHQIRFQPGLNEALAASSVLGSQQVEASGRGTVDGVFAMWYGKGPGVDWAGDAIKHGNAFGTSPHGGVLAIAGDDHGAVSSTMAHQSDQTFKAWSMPVLHPASVADYVGLGLYGWALSRFCGAWVGLKAVSETIEGAASFELGGRTKSFEIPNGFVPPEGGLHMRMVDPPSVAIETRLLAKIEAARAFARLNSPDQLISDPDKARLAIISVGKAHGDVMEVLRCLGFDRSELLDKAGVRVLKIAQSWPLELHGLRHALRQVESVLVVEEKRPLVEDQVMEFLFREGRQLRLLGKCDSSGNSLLPASGELRPHILAPVIACELERIMPGIDLQPRLETMLPKPLHTQPLAKRTPYFCSGCPHNSSTVVPEGSIAFGGIGCHIMATWMDRETVGVTQMGGEGSSWIGMQPFVDRGHVFQNLGDGTYFHSGSLAIRAAIAAKSDITFKILFNDAVAMTGGQKHDGTLDVPAITRQLHAEGVGRIVVVADDPAKYPANAAMAPGVELRGREDLEGVQTELRQIKGVSAIVFDQTCAAEKRRRRKRGQYPDPKKRVVINHLVCEACGDCSKASNCLSIQPLETPFGTKRQIDQSSCNKDYSCLDGHCPSFVTVEGAELAKPKGLGEDLMQHLAAGLPHPALPAIDGVFNILVTGVGGTGVLTVGALIGMAAHLENRPVSVLDFTGLAQKGGAVLSHVRLSSKRDCLHQSRIEPGQTDTIIACDLVTAADTQAMATLAPGKSRGVANAHAAATAEFIKDPSYSLPLKRLQDRVARQLSSSHLPMVDAKKLAETALGDSIGSNVLMLGFAWQNGLLPVSLRALERAIELNGQAIEANKKAFTLGRIAAADKQALASHMTRSSSVAESLEAIIKHRKEHLQLYQNRAYASIYERLVENIAKREAEVTGSQGELARTVAIQLFRLMAVKDEYEVARLHTDGRFKAELLEMFEPGHSRRYAFAPPLAEKFLKRKLSFGSWIEPVLRLMAHGRRLRHTPFDPLGWTKEKRQDRAVLDDYRNLLEEIIRDLNRSNIATAIEQAKLADQIRGFGHVRTSSIKNYWSRRKPALC